MMGFSFLKLIFFYEKIRNVCSWTKKKNKINRKQKQKKNNINKKKKSSSKIRLCVGEVDFECGKLDTVNVLLMYHSR